MNKVKPKSGIASRITRKPTDNPERHEGAIADSDLTKLASASRAHDWLRDADQDIYTLSDGKTALWPARHTNGAA
jgi:hypothetical protein